MINAFANPSEDRLRTAYQVLLVSLLPRDFVKVSSLSDWMLNSWFPCLEVQAIKIKSLDIRVAAIDEAIESSNEKFGKTNQVPIDVYGPSDEQSLRTVSSSSDQKSTSSKSIVRHKIEYKQISPLKFRREKVSVKQKQKSRNQDQKIEENLEDTENENDLGVGRLPKISRKTSTHIQAKFELPSSVDERLKNMSISTDQLRNWFVELDA